jgi:hypothetical protein
MKLVEAMYGWKASMSAKASQDAGQVLAGLTAVPR